METGRIGVFICHCGTNIAGKLSVEELKNFAKTLPHVIAVSDTTYTCSEVGQASIQDTIKEHNLTHVVVAACSPSMHEKTFRATIEKSGLNPYMLAIANIREMNTWVTEDSGKSLEKAKKLVAAAVRRVITHEPLVEDQLAVTPRVVVVGGGIAGIEASLQLANADKEVVLVEREPSIGGQMARFDKTFPTLDCASCILTPKMVEVGQHPNITLMTYSEVEDFSGVPGQYNVKIRKKGKSIDEELCTGCGICEEKCPIKKIPSEFYMGLGNRKAVYRPFPQAVPQYPVIDRENCTYYLRGKCKICEKECPTGAIVFDQEDTIIEVEAGAVILATGYEPYNPSPIPQYHYGEYENIFRAIEVETMLNASGPTGGAFLLRKEGKFTDESPKTVGIIHCVGSRDDNYNSYCSRVCCMYSLKYAHLIKERIDATIFQFYIDIRAFGKGYEEFYDRLQKEGVIFIRGKPGQILKDGDKLVVQVEDSLSQKALHVPVDAVILSSALAARSDAKQVATMFGIGCGAEDFFRELHPKLAPVDTQVDGIFLAGACQGPKDIPDAVAQGAAAAAGALRLISRGYVAIEPTIASIDEDLCSNCKMCISICPYDAIAEDTEKKVAVLTASKCKGCGLCPSICPSGAIHHAFYSDEAILEEIKGIIETAQLKG
ncbi:MAG: CoB--CoM heterodisulfide reductase iron-sulfur subunit A family protein [Candidatus Heimdallarchaeota archaeon]|nr:MAG: CoB--CoM heterodisulfide reductase iron-sulfur subunit A family protein [Candidatus Heimdallarchaeota archaeon]